MSLLGYEDKILIITTPEQVKQLDLSDDGFDWIILEKLWAIEDEQDFERLVHQLKMFTKLRFKEDEYCMCGNPKAPEHDFCKECI